MIIITEEILIEENNTAIHSNVLNHEKTIKNMDKIYYMSLVDDNIYYKICLETKNIPNNEITCKFNILDPLNPYQVLSFNNNYGLASHNMYFFKDKENKTKAIGGQHYGIISYNNDIKNNTNYSDYHAGITFIDSSKYQITYTGYNEIYNHNEICPYYANGLHLFDKIDDKLICLNNNLPIISGVHEGRYDGHYGYCNTIDLNYCRNGLTVYDSIGSVIYNKEKDLYFLYHRSNIGLGLRTIQYTTSKDLLIWDEFNLVNFGDEYDFFNSNIYYSNFFNIPNTNIYLAILPYNKKKSSDYYAIDSKEEYRLYYSFDCINYKYIGNIHENYDLKILEDYAFTTNLPYYFNDMMYFYIYDNINLNLNIYSLKKNRYLYINNKTDNESVFKIKLDNYLEEIKLNINVKNNGYLILELLDINKQIINNYSFDEFNKISDIDSTNYIASWNNESKIPKNTFYISFKLYNAMIYSIE